MHDSFILLNQFDMYSEGAKFSVYITDNDELMIIECFHMMSQYLCHKKNTGHVGIQNQSCWIWNLFLCKLCKYF